MLFAVLCGLQEKQGAEVKELPLVPSCKWKVGLRNRVCWPHKLIIITKIVTRNVKYKSYLEEDYKEFPWSPTTVVYHNHLGLDQPWSTWSVCGVRTGPGFGRTLRSGEREEETPQASLSPTAPTWRQARTTGLSTRARKATGLFLILISTSQASNSLSLSLRGSETWGHMTEINEKQTQSQRNCYQSLQVIHRSLSFHVHERWDVVSGACSKVCLSLSAVFPGDQGTRLGKK